MWVERLAAGLYDWARACVRSRSNMEAMTLFSVLMVRRPQEVSFISTDSKTRAPLLTVRPANLEKNQTLLNPPDREHFISTQYCSNIWTIKYKQFRVKPRSWWRLWWVTLFNLNKNKVPPPFFHRFMNVAVHTWSPPHVGPQASFKFNFVKQWQKKKKHNKIKSFVRYDKHEGHKSKTHLNAEHLLCRED